MLVSIVIPVYNAARYLRKCLDSCLSQTYGEFEIVCVNDGSTDDSLEILRSYGGRIKLIDQSNCGVVAARARAIRESRGDFIYFLDSDDWLPETALADLMEVVDDETDMVFGDQYVARTNGGRYCEVMPGLEWTGVEYVNEVIRHVAGRIGGKMIRADICRRLRIDTIMRLNEDLLMNVQVGILANKIRHVSMVNYYYNWANETSLSKAETGSSLSSQIIAHQRIVELLKSDSRLAEIGTDGYVPYLMRNAMTVCLGPIYFRDCEFVSRETRRLLLRAPLRYCRAVVGQGFWGWVLLLAPVSVRFSRWFGRGALKIRLCLLRRRK